MSTPAKFAAVAFGIVLFLPILALTILAGTVAIVVFGLLFLVSLITKKYHALTKGKHDNEGRKNVKVRR